MQKEKQGVYINQILSFALITHKRLGSGWGKELNSDILTHILKELMN